MRSFFTAETLAMSADAIDYGIHLTKMISELLFNDLVNIPIELYSDNISLYDSLKSKKNVSEKQLWIHMTIKKELFEIKL